MATFSYTPEITESIVEQYVESGHDNSCLPTLADQLGVTVASVRSKLVREGVYVKQAPSSRSGKGRTSKMQYVNAIAAMLDMPAGDAASLEKATLKTLVAMSEKLIAIGDRPQ